MYNPDTQTPLKPDLEAARRRFWRDVPERLKEREKQIQREMQREARTAQLSKGKL